VSIRVLIADDQPVIRSGLRAILEDEDDIEVVGEAEDGVQAVALAPRRGADVVLMDVRMPRMDGIEATRLLTGAGEGGGDDEERAIDVVVITTFDLDEYVFGALRAGASGFLLKDARPDVLVGAIRAVAAGQGLIAPEVTRRLIARFAAVSPEPAAAASGLEELSDREREVLLLIAEGNSNAQIAAILGVEETTVKTHVSAILLKLHLRSRVQAVILAYETGLVTPGARR
jgi:DNA-binding NarL/FixJ family response regulator